jgi:hypothetical protein
MSFQHNVWWLSGNFKLVAQSTKSLMIPRNETNLIRFRCIKLKTVLMFLTE